MILAISFPSFQQCFISTFYALDAEVFPGDHNPDFPGPFCLRRLLFCPVNKESELSDPPNWK